MLFNSPLFLFLFLPVTVAGYYWLRLRGGEGYILWLSAASLLFYAVGDIAFVPVILASIVANYAVGWCIHTSRGVRRKGWLTFGLAGNLGLLAYFKYSNFFMATLNTWTGLGLEWAWVVLPLGISFFTFQKIAYLVDVYRGLVGRYRFTHYALFVLFFPQLIAGPIVHHQEIMPQFTRPLKRIPEHLAVGLTLLIAGLFKKVVLADQVAVPSSAMFNAAAAGEVPGMAEAWVGTLCYTMQLYFDFSAYSDMAIGLGRMFGIHIPINFVSPYKSRSITEFWRRWHITLSRFLRDYLYIPLGGNRCGKARQMINLFVTMFLGGIWHGAGWTFMLWGMLHGMFLVIHHRWSQTAWAQRLQGRTGWKITAWTVTFLAVMLAWVPFRAASLEASVTIWSSMFGLNGWESGVSDLPKGWKLAFWLLPVVLFAPNLYQWLQKMRVGLPVEGYGTTQIVPIRWQWKPDWRYALILSLLLVTVILKLNDPSEFIYFQF